MFGRLITMAASKIILETLNCAKPSNRSSSKHFCANNWKLNSLTTRGSFLQI